MLVIHKNHVVRYLYIKRPHCGENMLLLAIKRLAGGKLSLEKGEELKNKIIWSAPFSVRWKMYSESTSYYLGIKAAYDSYSCPIFLFFMFMLVVANSTLPA